MLPKSLVLICRTASVVSNMRSPTICALRLSFFFIWAVLCQWASPHTTHFSFLVQFSALCPKLWHLKHWRIEGVVLNSSTLKIMPVFWHTSPPESRASAGFWFVIFYIYKRQVFACSFRFHSFSLGMGYFVEIKQFLKIFNGDVVWYSYKY